MTENNRGQDRDRDRDELIPIVTIAAEVGEPIDVLVGRFSGFVELNAWGCRCVPLTVAMEELARQWEWRQRHAEENRQRAEELAEKAAPVPAGVPAQEGLSALETLMAQPDYQTVQDELGWPKPRFLEEQLAEGARQREAQAREAAVKRMRDDLR